MLSALCWAPLCSVKAQKPFTVTQVQAKPDRSSSHFHSPSSLLIRYTGRIQWLRDAVPRFWAPGVYITATFKGDFCRIYLTDQVLYGNTHNYIEIAIDNLPLQRIQTRFQDGQFVIGGLSRIKHTITICKDSESGIGFLDFTGMDCAHLVASPPRPARKIEFIGNSITCGNAMDLSEIPCGKGQWYDQQNAFMSYGPVTARSLHAQWVLSSVSGIGMIHSCCDMHITTPMVFDKINMRNDSLKWDFGRYQPDVVTICLGQNDGIQDSTAFCSAYVQFIHSLREHYPKATLICLSSPMADSALTVVLKKYLGSIVAFLNESGDHQVYSYFFSRSFHHGCGGHPDLAQHQLIAKELTAYIRHLENW